MAGYSPTRVISFLLLATCGALCQQRADSGEWNSLPDAPSAQTSAQPEISPTPALRMSANGLRSPLTVGAVGENGSGILVTDRNRAARAFGALAKEDSVQKGSSDVFEKYLYPSLLKRNLNYHPSSSASLMGRTSYAASRIFITQDDAGRGRLNTSYFLAVLSSAVVHMARRPSWDRSAATPFSDFGSTIGNDAGINLLHEFGPGLHQLMKSHAPKFVSRIEERIGHN